MKVYSNSELPRIPKHVQKELTESGLNELTYEQESLPLPEMAIGVDGIEDLLESFLKVGFNPKQKFSGDIQRDVWLKVDVDGNYTAVEPPSDLIGFVDTETINIHHSLPVMAVIVADKGVFIYVDSGKNPDPTSIYSRLPLGSNNKLIAYNASFDRSQFAPSYSLDDTNRWLDVMSVFTMINGYSNQQRSIVKKISNDTSSFRPDWYDSTVDSLSLKSVASYYGIEISKDVRDEIISLGMNAFRGINLIRSLDYCYQDVVTTIRVSKIALRKLQKMNPIATNGLIERNNELLPLSKDWETYYLRNEESLNNLENGISEALLIQADKILDLVGSDKLTEQQSLLDWTPLKSGANKGLPKWYVSLTKNPSIGLSITPYILGIKYKGHPVLKVGKHWTANGEIIPHPKNGQPISKLFVKGCKYETDDEFVQGILDNLDSIINWKMSRKMASKVSYIDMGDYLLHVPKLMGWGTISRRKNDTWMVLPNPKAKRIGTESRLMVMCPDPNKTLVTFDVDSEEALIASIIGDLYKSLDPAHPMKEPLTGSCPFSYSTLVGDKNDGTDIHSLIANQVGIDRQDAKALNYGAIYGQGLNGTVQTLFQAGLSVSDSQVKGRAYYQKMKGTKGYDRWLRSGLGSHIFNGLDNLSKGVCKSLLLGMEIPPSLQSDDDFKTTKQNWIIQSTGSDILDMLVAGFYQLAGKMGINARIIHTHHDSLTVLCDKEDAQSVAVILSTVHQNIWVKLYNQMSINIIPTSVLIPSEIEISQRLKYGETPNYKVAKEESYRTLNPQDVVKELDIISKVSSVLS